MSASTLARGLAPPVLVDLYRRWSGKTLRFIDVPEGWDEAVRLSTGYADGDILERVLAATRAVVSGQAAFERDSVLFDAPELPFPLLAALLRAAVIERGDLTVVDFGGALGSTYRQCRDFLDGLSRLRWHVVEQSAFAQAGREFATDELRFFAALDELPALSNGAVIVASSVLQYLADPLDTLRRFAAMSARHLVIDRTPMHRGATDRLCIQQVPSHIYRASYPCWIFSQEALLERLAPHWRVVADHPCAEGASQTEQGSPFEFRGLVLERLA
ncbi:MAG: methyltransferase, TIGR04325 family [Caldimonas sp.]